MERISYITTFALVSLLLIGACSYEKKNDLERAHGGGYYGPIKEIFITYNSLDKERGETSVSYGRSYFNKDHTEVKSESLDRNYELLNKSTGYYGNGKLTSEVYEGYFMQDTIKYTFEVESSKNEMIYTNVSSDSELSQKLILSYKNDRLINDLSVYKNSDWDQRTERVFDYKQFDDQKIIVEVTMYSRDTTFNEITYQDFDEYGNWITSIEKGDKYSSKITRTILYYED